MSALSLRHVPDPVQEFEVVDVPEFGTDEDGHAWQVNVYPLTVESHSIYIRYISKYEIKETDDGEEELFFAGTNMSRSGNCILAALTARDDDGKLVFGVDYEDAIKRVESLHRRYYPSVVRIAQSTMKQSREAIDAKNGVAVAEKN